MRKIYWQLTALSFALMTKAVFAHGGEDHSKEEKKPPVTSASAAQGGAPLMSTVAFPQRLADGSLFVPKLVQRQLGIRTVVANIGELAASVTINGRVIADPESGGRVQASFAGRIVPGPKGMPVPGRKVSKGEVLAYLSPIASAIERGNQQAQLADLEAQLAIATTRLRRAEQLEGVLPQKDIEAARIEQLALQKRRAAVSGSIISAEALIAPTTGIISSTNLVAGQVVDAKEILFEIIDPKHLAVEALAYDVSLATGVLSASARNEQAGQSSSAALELKFIGAGRQLREQALPLLFAIVTPDAMVAVGQPLTVVVRTAGQRQGAAVPRSALTKLASGETAVWVHTEAERFVIRKVSDQPLDAVNIAIVDGLHDKDRVVTEGAGLLSQVR